MDNQAFPRLRILNAAPGSPPLDVESVARDLKFGEFSQYVTIRPGSVPITIQPTGGGDPVFAGVIILDMGEQYTGAIIGRPGDIDFQLIPEPALERVPWLSHVRFVHLAPGTPRVDLTYLDGTVLFSDVSYREFTDYRTIDPDIYTFQLREAGTDRVLLTIPDVWALAFNQISLYAVGERYAEEDSLQVLQVVDDPHGCDIVADVDNGQ